jgi:hypothetical protein
MINQTKLLPTTICDYKNDNCSIQVDNSDETLSYKIDHKDAQQVQSIVKSKRSNYLRKFR